MAKSELETAYTNAAADAAASVAAAMMTTAFLHPDPKASAEAFAKAHEWTMRGVMIRAVGFTRAQEAWVGSRR